VVSQICASLDSLPWFFKSSMSRLSFLSQGSGAVTRAAWDSLRRQEPAVGSLVNNLGIFEAKPAFR
jgi:hypothetical protein